MKIIEKVSRLIPFLLVVMYAVGTAGHLIGATRPLMLRLTPAILLLLGLPVLVLAVLQAPPDKRAALALWCAGTYAATFAVEALGVATGRIFGAYRYGETLGLQLWDVPLVIGFNWVLVVAAAAGLSTRVTRHPLIGAAVAGLLTVIFDWALEPVAMRLDYWNWEGDIIPLQNYAAWFAVAATASLVYRLLGFEIRGRILPIYCGIQFLFFLVLRWGL